MRFFKYLIFIFLSILSIPAFAATTYSAGGNFGTSPEFPTKAAACSWFTSVYGETIIFKSGTGEGYCAVKSNGGSVALVVKHITPDECFYPDYKIVSQPITSLKKTMCLPVNGAICKYTGDPTGSPIVNGKITTTFSSVSKTPEPSCKEELVNAPCDPKDPYGGCFTPPDDNCTRQFNGSIECPPDVQPKVQKGCSNGATYCDRPPQGCGEGYVSGSFNSKQICIKTSPSTGTGGDGTGGDGTGGDGTGGDGSGTGSSTGTGTGTSTSTNTTTNSDGSTTTTTNTTVNNFSIDFSPVVNAVNRVSEKLTNFKNELLTSISDLSNQIGLTNNKIDQTNSKLDDTNTNLTSIKDSSLRQEELLKEIRDKSGSDSASAASVDLTETNGILGEIRDGINSIKDVFSDEGKEQLEQLGQESNDSRSTSAQSNAQNSLNSLANNLTFSNSACVSDFQIQIPIFGSINIALSQWCGLLALLKILIHLAVLLVCLRMIDASVRTI